MSPGTDHEHPNTAENVTNNTVDNKESNSSEIDDNDSARPKNRKPTHERRWEHLRRFYNDGYLELFNETYISTEHDEDLTDSQIGSVTWTRDEKTRFFVALSRKGKNDLEAIRCAVPTKSIVEISDYLLRLREGEAHRQRYSQNVRNVSISKIDAAVEVGRGCEAMLEKAADALAAYQDHFDMMAAKNGTDAGDSRHWLIDTDIAASMDLRVDAELETSAAEDIDFDTDFDEVASLFQVSNMLELSQNLFMNSVGRPEEVLEDEPTMTGDVLSILRALVVSFTSRVLQTSLFLAQSRIRSQSFSNSDVAHTLRVADVEAALDVLNLPADSWEYWTKYARRSGVKVILGRNKQGRRRQAAMSLNEVETALSVRHVRGRRPSLVSADSTSSGRDTDVDEIEKSIEVEIEDEAQPKHQEMHGNSDEDEDYNDDVDEDESEEASEIDDTPQVANVDERVSSNEDESNSTEGLDSTGHTGNTEDNRPAKRKLTDEDRDMEYAERLDKVNRLKEEAYLRSKLGLADDTQVEERSLGKRPPVRRKTEEELVHWTDSVQQAIWECQ